ncbi:hypothetical protein A3J20_03045 [Candidatus Gottesmanbacteria bacterium RIFCSPLOWO2_02_FULL_42_29]|uniref:Hydrogenase/sulfur reductase subunit alpha n=2 Tax=Candidatus Gottesmaniibacteriota TaxID=1752720 RepID=A0A1F6B7N9_9BACT|nr:MAG: Nickel-dependent hydrogenase large subunit [Candidatus Gottesmanbacteria bacterium GW2011_GWA2_42_18]KKS75912.1 MAG: Nickel-dependent hydrogenase large subunit [Candidatus Gottesmanbacteria bacterium GW2011_GWC2_42_8]OGG10842.1 MAG: hypothetical protein A2781_01940 [Candidatus Gottesmanbacteria bacterium RIFCSPHIGHO2_01_FULL_42_27]OGG19985.1 MAG: hypothetical protein A3E72_01320 [Candidatus Gottesmanbacteria bacterium RIFCSPHIGHO2_12_FULL_43_26]OGG32935.1 MAG: hypothetical protein A2968
MHNLDLSLSDISKIEGKASCDIKIRHGKVEDVKFSISEFKRFYTRAIKGKDIVALPQLTCRICGTCSNAHLLCAIKACEKILDIHVSEQTVKLRRLLNFGLLIRDHALHLYIFVMPDFFGHDSILEFKEDDSLEHKFLHDAFQVKAVGNHLSIAVGGRSVHAPYAVVGGFTRLPNGEELKKCSDELSGLRNTVIDLIKLFKEKDKTLIRPDLQFAALLDSEYSFLDGEIYHSKGRERAGKYGDNLEYVSIPYSHASGFRFKGKTYMTGALARLNLGKDKLHPKTRQSLNSILDLFPSNNIYHNNLAQAIEILHCLDSAADIIKNFVIKEEKPLPINRKAGTGAGVIEAPRGILYYRLSVDGGGKVIKGEIVVPTGQNQIGIEESIRLYLENNLTKFKEKEDLEKEIESIVRAYDPCMSCASHFLKTRYS